MFILKLLLFHNYILHSEDKKKKFKNILYSFYLNSTEDTEQGTHVARMGLIYIDNFLLNCFTQFSFISKHLSWLTVLPHVSNSAEQIIWAIPHVSNYLISHLTSCLILPHVSYYLMSHLTSCPQFYRADNMSHSSW